MNPVLSCQNLCCHRSSWNESQPASVRDVTLSFRLATFYEFEGPDEPGKDLLLNTLGLLEPADSGTIYLDGRNTREVPEDHLRRLRNERFGFLFEHPCLLPSFSVAENVAMPLFRICGTDTDSARVRTHEVLGFCGIAHLENQLAGRLPLAEQRRTALARALVHHPGILVAISAREDDELSAFGLRAADELGLCVLWSRLKGGSGNARRIIQVRSGCVSFSEGP